MEKVADIPAKLPNDLLAFLESFWVMAENIIAKDEELIQVCHFEGEDPDELGKPAIAVVMCPWGDESERSYILKALRKAGKDFKAYRYVFLAETWGLDPQYSGLSYEEAYEEAQNGEIRNSPHRISMVTAVAVDARTGEGILRQGLATDAPGRKIRDVKTLHGVVVGLHPDYPESSFGDDGILKESYADAKAKAEESADDGVFKLDGAIAHFLEYQGDPRATAH